VSDTGSNGKPLKVAEHAQFERRIGSQQVLDIAGNRARLGGAGGVPFIVGRLVGAEQRIAADPRGEVDVDQRHLLAVEAEGADQRLAGAVIGRVLDQAEAALDEVDPVGIVEIAVADIPAALTAGGTGLVGCDLDINIVRDRRLP
jgi:hypothetical protein